MSDHVFYPPDLYPIVREARRFCIDVTSVQFYLAFDLLAFMQKARYAARQYENVLSANDLNALEIVYMAAEKELNRREQGGTSPSHLHITGYVYLLATAIGYYKIGCSSKPHNRLMTFGIQLPFAVECVHTIFSVDMYGLEAELHQRFQEKRAQGEWFRLSPADIDYIKGLAR